ncbi:MAG: ComEC family competence protein [Alphaproteobacteria bacterium]|nr:ComEC family competence protein [Alphaproteobacteria bacterium]
MKRNKHFLELFFDQSDRWPLWMPVLFGAGIGFYFSLSYEPQLKFGLGILAIVSVGCAVVRRHPFLFILLLALSTFFAGFVTAQIRTVAVNEPVLDKRIGPTTISGHVTVVEEQPKGVRITLERVRIGTLEAHKTPHTVRLKIRKSTKRYLPGDWIKTTAILMPPMAPVAPGAFDFQRHAFFKRLGGLGFTLGEPIILEREEKASTSPQILISQIRTEISSSIRKQVEGPVGAVIAALMTGDRGGINEKVMEDIRHSGLAHLLAISGLHIGLVSAFVFFTLRTIFASFPNLALRYPIKKWAALMAVLVALIYSFLVGATVPTQRAFIMVSIVFLAIVFDRQGVSLRTLSIAAFFVLFLQPESLISPSFQMSFAAVTALIATYERVGEWMIKRNIDQNPSYLVRLRTYFFGVALTTVIATLATTPFALYHFNSVALYGVFANLIAVPLMAFLVMPLIVLTWILIPLGAGVLLLPLLEAGVSAIVQVASYFSAYEGAVMLVKAPSTLFIFLITLGGLWICLFKGRISLVGIPVVLIAILLFSNTVPPNLLIDETGQLKGIFLENENPRLSTLRKSKITSERWLERAGYEGKGAVWPTFGNKENNLLCDSQGCIFETRGTSVSFVNHPSAALEDCHAVHVLISSEPIRQACKVPKVVIDRFDLWREGAHALWIENENKIKVQTVAEHQGLRPWSSYAKRQ